MKLPFFPLKRIYVWPVAVAFALIFAMLAYHWYQKRLSWSGYLYSSSNSGKDPEFMGEYDSKEVCLEEMSQALKNSPVLPSGDIADAYLCGRGCAVETGRSKPRASEIQCQEREDKTLSDLSG